KPQNSRWHDGRQDRSTPRFAGSLSTGATIGGWPSHLELLRFGFARRPRFPRGSPFIPRADHNWPRGSLAGRSYDEQADHVRGFGWSATAELVWLAYRRYDLAGRWETFLASQGW